jgi:glycosyltransferase involved in cell wall biosynthesis
LLVPPEDSTALANALLRLLKDPDLSRRMATSGQKIATEDYSFGRLIRQTDALYSELLERRGRNG